MTLNEFLQAMDSRGSGASEKSIALVEKELGGKLPADYRDFLLKSNGGSCGGGVIFKKSGPSIHHVFGLRSEKHLSLSWRLKLQRKGNGMPIPDDQIAIMDDPGGSPICLVWQGRKSGEIHRWGPMATKRIAGSLVEFIKGIREFSEEDDD